MLPILFYKNFPNSRSNFNSHLSNLSFSYSQNPPLQLQRNCTAPRIPAGYLPSRSEVLPSRELSCNSFGP